MAIATIAIVRIAAVVTVRVAVVAIVRVVAVATVSVAIFRGTGLGGKKMGEGNPLLYTQSLILKRTQHCWDHACISMPLLRGGLISRYLNLHTH